MRMTTTRKNREVQTEWRFVCQQPVAAIFTGIAAAPIQGNQSCWQKTALRREADVELFPNLNGFEKRGWGDSGEVRR